MEVKKTRSEHIQTPQNTAEKLNGLVLAGGHSIRMGTDKGEINWHGKAHRYFLADLLKPFCNNVFISCRKDQQSSITENGYNPIADKYEDIGPYAALLSGFQHETSAWLVIACDFPLMNAHTIEYLIGQRDKTCIATSYANIEDGLPEPLAAIWEPQAYDYLTHAFKEKKYSLRQLLIENRVKLVNAINKEVLLNVNTKSDVDLLNGLQPAALPRLP